MKSAIQSPKTTAAGVLAALVALATAALHQFDGDPTTPAEWGVAVSAVVMAVGLILSRDNDVSSETAGAN